MEPRRRVGSRRGHTQCDALEIRDAGFASSILNAGTHTPVPVLLSIVAPAVATPPTTIIPVTAEALDATEQATAQASSMVAPK